MDIFNKFNYFPNICQGYKWQSCVCCSQAFSSNKQPTIITTDPAYQNKIGNRYGLSFRDIKLANLMYSCAGMYNTLTIGITKYLRGLHQSLVLIYIVHKGYPVDRLVFKQPRDAAPWCTYYLHSSYKHFPNYRLLKSWYKASLFWPNISDILLILLPSMRTFT